MFYWTMFLTFGLLAISLFFTIIKRRRLKETQLMFRRYNESGDMAVITDWVKERFSALRLLQVLEYLHKIEEEELAAKVYLALPFDEWPTRHTRVLAIKALRKYGHEEALTLADRMIEAHQDDDSILEIYLDTQITFGKLEEARKILPVKLNMKDKGTAFKRLNARMMAAEGKLDEAIEAMEAIVARDYMLYKNTLAPVQKKLIYEQYVDSQKLLDAMKNEKGGTNPREDRHRERC